MKTCSVSISKLKNIYKNPAIVLFRWLELNAIHTEISQMNISLGRPSIDLGCGNGEIASILFNEKFSIGLDNNEAGDVKNAIESNKYKKVIIENAENISLNSSSISLVFSNSVIEHIPNINAVLNSVYRILKKNGLFIFTVPTANFSKNLFFSSIFNSIKIHSLANKYAKYRNRKLNHYHLYTHLKWSRILKNHGFNILSYRYYISPRNLQLWDFAAISFKILSPFMNQEIVWKLFEKPIKKAIKNDKFETNKGSGLLIIAQKNEKRI